MTNFLCRAQLINIETLGSSTGTGVFFPNGYVGAITTPAGYSSMDSGLGSFPTPGTGVATQVILCTAFLTPLICSRQALISLVWPAVLRYEDWSVQR